MFVKELALILDKYSLANVASATFPIKAVLYEIITRFAEEAIASCSTARPTRMAKRAEAVAAANPATHTATKREGNLSRLPRHINHDRFLLW